MLDEMQEEEEKDEEEDKCNENRWTKKIMDDEMREEEEDENRLRTIMNNKKINTTKLSYRSSEGRSSSRRFRKCRKYDGKSSRLVRKVDILTLTRHAADHRRV